MIDGRHVLAVVPARGGSKTVPLKNIKLLDGRPLIAHVSDVVRNVAEIDRAVVSTDHDEIARVAEESGLAVPFRRPEPIAGDRIGDWDVLNHALLETEKIDGQRYDIIVMLQPTSPLRSAADVQATIGKLVAENLDAVWTVSETDSKNHPLKQLTVHDGLMDYFDPDGGKIIARQQLSTLYHRNGVAYAITRCCLLNQQTIKGARTGAHIVTNPMVSIDTLWDFQLVEFLLQQEKRSTT
jgi:CMP-N,N'-diacetyllegionaminic acid synthase